MAGWDLTVMGATMSLLIGVIWAMASLALAGRKSAR